MLRPSSRASTYFVHVAKLLVAITRIAIGSGTEYWRGLDLQGGACVSPRHSSNTMLGSIVTSTDRPSQPRHDRPRGWSTKFRVCSPNWYQMRRYLLDIHVTICEVTRITRSRSARSKSSSCKSG